jgi:hypothetical protein
MWWTTTGSFGTNIAILEKASCLDDAIFSNLVMAISVPNDPLLIPIQLMIATHPW